MTPAYPELVAAVRREGASLLAAAALGGDAEVPTCPGWSVADLVRHVGRVYQRTATLLSTRATTAPDPAPELPPGDPVPTVSDLLDDLVAQLGEADPDTPVWNWSGTSPQVAAFWARRMAHESAVHRYDVQRAHGVAEPIDEELAADGIDELLDVVLPRVLARDETSLPVSGHLRLAAADNGEWRLHVAAGGVERVDRLPDEATVAAGTSSTLLLALYGRVPWSNVKVEGDASLLHGFAATVRF